MNPEEITRELQLREDPIRARHSLRYFKTAPGEYAEGDRFLGIRVPEIRNLAKKYKNISIDDSFELLTSEIHEIRLLSLFILVKHAEKPALREIVARRYLENTRFINNWDLVDSSASQIVGSWLFNDLESPQERESVLDKLSESELLWDRRISIISTLYFIKKNEFSLTLRLCRKLLGDHHDLIHKATGWMLREVGKIDLNTELEFLNVNYSIMPRTMLRYSIEKFPEPLRQQYLKGEIS
ncbi:MAG: DNA alkylation repair protein [Deltaproteobacteria bacterium]|nr:DNA alkylation repair protein [Deltaproteobacteria bacterium]